MTRAFEPHQHVTGGAVKLATTGLIGGMLVLGLGCTGAIGLRDDGPGGTGSGVGASGGSQPGTGGMTGDPYSIPPTAPATVLVATPRVSRLSRQQWSNAVRDLLQLTDISAIEANVSADALIGFDDE